MDFPDGKRLYDMYIRTNEALNIEVDGWDTLEFSDQFMWDALAQRIKAEGL